MQAEGLFVFFFKNKSGHFCLRNQYVKYHIFGWLCNTIFVSFGIIDLTFSVSYSHISQIEETASIPSNRYIDILCTARKHNCQVKPATPALRLKASGSRSCLWCYRQHTSWLGDCREVLQRLWRLPFTYCHSCQLTIPRVDLWNNSSRQ